MRLSHGKDHLKTGILILITILLTNATLFVGTYHGTPNREYTGQVTLNDDGIPPAAVLVGKFDERTGEPSRWVHICEIPPLRPFYNWCPDGDDATPHAKYFHQIGVDIGIEFNKNTTFFRPQDEDGDDITNLDAWVEFVINYLDAIIDENTNGLQITAHAKYLGAQGDNSRLVIEAAGDISGADSALYSDIANGAWNDIQNLPYLSHIKNRFSEISIARFTDLFYLDDHGVWFNWDLFENIPQEDRPNLSAFLICSSGKFPFSPILHLGPDEIVCSGAIENDFALVYERMLGIENGGTHRTSEKAEYGRDGGGAESLPIHFKTLGEAGFDFNFSLNPAFKDVSYACNPGGRSAVVIGTLDTFADPREGKTEVVPSAGNVVDVQGPEWGNYRTFAGDGSEYPTSVSVNVLCNGVCDGAIKFQKLTGVGAIYSFGRLITDPDGVFQGLNGNSVPIGSWDGREKNFTSTGLDDPRIIPIQCGGGETPPSTGKVTTDCPAGEECDGGGPIIQPPASVCGNGVIDAGEDCETNADCPAIETPWCTQQFECRGCTCVRTICALKNEPLQTLE